MKPPFLADLIRVRAATEDHEGDLREALYHKIARECAYWCQDALLGLLEALHEAHESEQPNLSTVLDAYEEFCKASDPSLRSQEE